MYRWCCSVVGVMPGLAMAAGGQVAFRAPGVCPLWLWALCSCCFFSWYQGVVSCLYLAAPWLLGAVCVALLVSAAPVRIGCFLSPTAVLGPFSCAPVLVLLIRARRLALHLGVCLLGFPAVVCAVTPVPPYCASL